MEITINFNGQNYVPARVGLAVQPTSETARALMGDLYCVVEGDSDHRCVYVLKVPKKDCQTYGIAPDRRRSLSLISELMESHANLPLKCVRIDLSPDRVAKLINYSRNPSADRHRYGTRVTREQRILFAAKRGFAGVFTERIRREDVRTPCFLGYDLRTGKKSLFAKLSKDSRSVAQSRLSPDTAVNEHLMLSQLHQDLKGNADAANHFVPLPRYIGVAEGFGDRSPGMLVFPRYGCPLSTLRADVWIGRARGQRSLCASLHQMVAHLETTSIIHADLKPENIMVDWRNRCFRLTDFAGAVKIEALFKEANGVPWFPTSTRQGRLASDVWLFQEAAQVFRETDTVKQLLSCGYPQHPMLDQCSGSTDTAPGFVQVDFDLKPLRDLIALLQQEQIRSEAGLARWLKLFSPDALAEQLAQLLKLDSSSDSDDSDMEGFEWQISSEYVKLKELQEHLSEYKQRVIQLQQAVILALFKGHTRFSLGAALFSVFTGELPAPLDDVGIGYEIVFRTDQNTLMLEQAGIVPEVRQRIMTLLEVDPHKRTLQLEWGDTADSEA